MKKPRIISYPEFGSDYRNWKNPDKFYINENLVKKLESLAKTPSGAPMFRVRFAPECFQGFDDLGEYNSTGMEVGVEKGGKVHQYPLVVYTIVAGFEYRSEITQKIEYVPFDQRKQIPADAIVSEVDEERSISVPRFVVEQFQDRSIHPMFGVGDYYKCWFVEEQVVKSEDEQNIYVESRRREFSEYDIDLCRQLLHIQRTMSKEDIAADLQKQKQAKAKADADKVAEERGILDDEIDKFFRDKEYMPKTKRVSVAVPPQFLGNIREQIFKTKEGAK